jgi:predicted nucleic acid-binding protein
VIVLDSSAAVEWLIELDHRAWVDDLVRADPSLHAPHLLDVEVLSVIRRREQRRELSPARARQAWRDLVDLDVARYPHLPFLDRMWQLRSNLTLGDAAFVALAEALGATLVTTDARLAAAPGLLAPIVAP